MALAKEILGASLLEKSSLFTNSSNLVLIDRQKGQFCFNPATVKTGLHARRAARASSSVSSSSTNNTTTVAAISERKLIKVVEPENAVQFKARAVVTVRNKHKEDLTDSIVKQVDAFIDKMGRNVVLELVSTELDPKTKTPKKSSQAALKDWSKKSNLKTERVNYIAEFVVDSSFGVPGAIMVANKHQQELFLESITLEGFACGPVHFSCNSWVQPRRNHPGKRIFFSNQPYLPSETPAGLKALRDKELRDLRGIGKDCRKLSDRIYDFATYNDLGNPDKGSEFARPLLGGEKIPYPRRCRTGRAPSETDLNSESRVEKPLPMYVPRDEQFEELKKDAFSTGRLKAVLHNLLPSLMTNISAKNNDFKGFSDIDNLYIEGLLLGLGGVQDQVLNKLPFPKEISKFREGDILKYKIPKILTKDKFAWLRDDEFARQALAGVNPVSIERLQAFPPVSKLDPEIYGPVESALKEEHIIGNLNGMTVQEALDASKLYILDHHDVYLPFLDKINALDGREAYATRTIYFSSELGTLKPIAIELSLPPTGLSSRAKRVVTPPVDATTNWIWQLAKAHVCANDAGVHQLVNHWLRTHAAVEPFILAAHRQMSAMHPIYKLMDPHMRYTLEINALARQALINSEGVIESCFTPGRYCMEISAAAYKNFYRFDQEGLPADLLRRGMAVPDETQAYGLKLLLEDYPYAADGLMIWTAMEDWVRKYVNRYYPDPTVVCKDGELQAWYAESINVGHADVRDADWWPTLATPEDLVSILTTLIWLSSAQHAALNFGQYPYGGYIPNRPPLMRRLIPDENDPEYSAFLADPQKYFFCALPSLLQATKYMAVVDTLSTHSPDEEYLGERAHPSTWTGDAEVIEAFYEFSAEIGRIEKEIEKRNANPTLRNRCGAGVIPYELLAPTSGPGVTCRGVPNSVSI